MADPSSTSSFERRGRRALWSFVWAIVLCGLVDSGFRWTLPAAKLVVRYGSARALVADSTAPDIEIVGDSVGRYGLLSSALAADDSVYVRNDAMEGSRLPFNYFLLRREFEAGHVPRAIVIAHTPYTFDAAFVARLAGTFAEWSELPEIFMTTRHWSDALFGTLARVSYILMNRASFRALLSGDVSFFVTPETENVQTILSDAGALELVRGGVFTGETPPFPFEVGLRETYLQPFQVDAETDTYFRRLLALAKAYDVRVFWITMPVPRTVHAAQTSSDFEADMLAYLQAFEERGDLVILQGPFIAYEDSLFRDPVHLRLPAAAKFACQLRQYAPELRDLVAQENSSRAVARDALARAVLVDQRESRPLLDELCVPGRLQQKFDFSSAERPDYESH